MLARNAGQLKQFFYCLIVSRSANQVLERKSLGKLHRRCRLSVLGPQFFQFARNCLSRHLSAFLSLMQAYQKSFQIGLNQYRTNIIPHCKCNGVSLPLGVFHQAVGVEQGHALFASAPGVGLFSPGSDGETNYLQAVATA